MEEARPGDVRHRRSDLLAGMNDIHTEGIDRVSSNIVTIHSGDQHFPFMIVHKQTTNHFRRFLTPGVGPEQVLRSKDISVSHYVHISAFCLAKQDSKRKKIK